MQRIGLTGSQQAGKSKGRGGSGGESFERVGLKCPVQLDHSLTDALWNVQEALKSDETRVRLREDSKI